MFSILMSLQYFNFCELRESEISDIPCLVHRLSKDALQTLATVLPPGTRHPPGAQPKHLGPERGIGREYSPVTL